LGLFYWYEPKPRRKRNRLLTILIHVKAVLIIATIKRIGMRHIDVRAANSRVVQAKSFRQVLICRTKANISVGRGRAVLKQILMLLMVL